MLGSVVCWFGSVLSSLCVPRLQPTGSHVIQSKMSHHKIASNCITVPAQNHPRLQDISVTHHDALCLGYVWTGGKPRWAGLGALEQFGECSAWVEKTRGDMLFRDKDYHAAAAAYHVALSLGVGDTGARGILHSDLGCVLVAAFRVVLVCVAYVGVQCALVCACKCRAFVSVHLQVPSAY